jgi:hypothetical protein
VKAAREDDESSKAEKHGVVIFIMLEWIVPFFLMVNSVP